MGHFQGSIEEEDHQGKHERMGTGRIGMSDEEQRKGVVRGTGYHLSCISSMENLVGFLCGKWIRGESLG